MEKDIVEAYIKYNCRECENRHTDLCHIAITNIKESRQAKCVWYWNSKIKRRRQNEEKKSKKETL